MIQRTARFPVKSLVFITGYRFEKARQQLNRGKVERVGLLATQGIRGGNNRTVLDRIKEDCELFWAESDREWILDGALVLNDCMRAENRTELL